MSKILDNAVVSHYAPKMIELRNGFVINGQYYLKDNMQPVPFNTVAITNNYVANNGEGLLHLDTTIKKSNPLNSSFDHSYSLIAYDSQDERYTYVVTRTGSYSVLIKFKEENNRCSIDSFVNVASNAYISVVKIEDYDDAIALYFAGGGNTTYRQFYSKQDLRITTKEDLITNGACHGSYPYDAVSFPEKNLTFKTGYGFIEYAYYAKELSKAIGLKITEPAQSSSNGTKHRLYVHNALSKDNEKIVTLYPRVSATGENAYIKEVDLCTYDLINNTWTKKTITVDNGDFEQNYYASNSSWVTDLWTRKINSKTYMFLYLRTLYSFNASRMLIFEYKEEQDDSEDTIQSITLVKKQEFPVGQSGRIIHFKDEDKFKFYGSCKANQTENSTFSSVYCYELNETSLEFEKTFDINGEIREFAFDKDRNLYILWEDLSVSRHNNRTVANFNAKFEQGLYEYEGEDIDTNLIISTTNLQGQYLRREVKLDIKGNAKFKENDTKSITVTTSDTEDLSIPVVITGAGALNIFPKIKA